MKQQSSDKSIMPTASLVVLVAVTFLTSLYLKGLDSGIPLYYDSIGHAATLGGTFVAVFTLACTVMRFIGGQITDHFSHYRVLLLSLLAMFIGVVIPIISDEFYVVIVSRIIQGMGFALSANVMTVAVMGSASKKHLGKRVGIKGVGTSLGTMTGALVATWLLDNVGYQGFYVFFAAIILVSIVAIAILRWRENAVAKKNAVKASVHNGGQTAGDGQGSSVDDADNKPATHVSPATQSSSTADSSSSPKAKAKQSIREFIAPYLYPQVAPYLVISFAWRMMRGFCIAFILIFAKHVDIGSGAMFFVAAGATTLVCRTFGGKLFDSDKAWLLFPLMGVEVIGFFLLAFTPTFPMLIVSAICYGVSIGTASPYTKALAAKASPKEHWGVVNGELFFFGDIGKALGAFCGGLIIDAVGKSFIPEIALGFAIFGLVVTGIALLTNRHIKPKSN